MVFSLVIVHVIDEVNVGAYEFENDAPVAID